MITKLNSFILESKNNIILDYIYNNFNIKKILKQFNNDNEDEVLNITEFTNIINELVNNIEYKNNLITVYRKILVKNNIVNNPLGISWAFNYNSAKIYNGFDYDNLNPIIIKANTKLESIDFENTIYLYCLFHKTSNPENEIKLKKSQKLFNVMTTIDGIKYLSLEGDFNS